MTGPPRLEYKPRLLAAGTGENSKDVPSVTGATSRRKCSNENRSEPWLGGKGYRAIWRANDGANRLHVR
jgi:hypothetical protein